MKRLLLLSFILFAAITFGVSQVTYFTEDLESGAPADWTTTGEWAFGGPAEHTSQYADFSTGSNPSLFYAFNDDAQGGAHVGGGRVVTGAIDLTAVTGDVWLEFEYWFLNADFDGADEVASVYVSKDDGTTWDLVADLAGVANWSYVPLRLSEYAGESIQIAFDYDDGAGWNFFFAIDNISILDAPINSQRRGYTFSINGGNLFSQVLQDMDYQVAGVITNSGYEPITSFDVLATEGGVTETYSFDGFNIPLGGAARYELPNTIKADGFKIVQFEISNVNGEEAPDDNIVDNSANLTLQPINTIHPDKAVLVEEATGTWCTWCPRGTAYMDEMSKRFGDHFAGIAVHNSDPMANVEYDAGVGAYPGFAGYPSVIWNRDGAPINPDAIVAPSIAEMSTAPAAKLEVGIDLDGILMSPRISVSFLEDMSDDFSVFMAITEDGLQEDGPGWAQVSGAYSGGANGPMAGFEYLPASVPAAVWPYDHVARAVIGGFNGTTGQITGTFAAGDGDSYVFPDYILNSDWNTENMHIIGVLLDGSGQVVNAVTTKFSDALANGTTSVEDHIDLSYLDVYPNPVTDNATVSLALKAKTNVQMSLMNSLGQKMSSVNYGDLVGNQRLDYNMSALNSGVYYLNIYVNGELITKKIFKS